MKKEIITGIAALILAMIIFTFADEAKRFDDKGVHDTAKGAFWGQEFPGLIPKIFGPGIVSTRYHEHSSPDFSLDGKEMFYTLTCDNGHVIMYVNTEDGNWSTPKPAVFSGTYSDDSHVWANDGTKLYFRSTRPFDNTTGNEYHNWIVSKTDTGWGDPEPNHFFAYSFTESGENYFYMKSEDTGWDIFRSGPGDSYRGYQKLGEEINSNSDDVTPCVAPDESYLLFASKRRDDTIGIMDLYISFREKDGSWTGARNLGRPVNTPGHISRFPRISPDGKFLFYWSNINNDEADGDSLSAVEEMLQPFNPWRPENGKDGDIYWVSIELIEKFRPLK